MKDAPAPTLPHRQSEIMSTATIDTYDSTQAESTIQYRTVHSGAIVSLVLGAFSAVTLAAGANSLNASLLVAPIPVVGLIIGLRSLASTRREPDVYTGGRLAAIGAVLSAVFLVTGVGYGAYVHVTEVPPDHTRISFPQMRPDVVEERAGIAVPPEIMALDGKRVFIKGYMRPPEVRSGIDRFLLVRDNNQCCFGDLSTVKYYDQILVDLRGSLRLNYSDKLFAVGGVLKVLPENAGRGPQAPVFAMQADHAK
jgi:hypothetical protein